MNVNKLKLMKFPRWVIGKYCGFLKETLFQLYILESLSSRVRRRNVSYLWYMVVQRRKHLGGRKERWAGGAGPQGAKSEAGEGLAAADFQRAGERGGTPGRDTWDVLEGGSAVPCPPGVLGNRPSGDWVLRVGVGRVVTAGGLGYLLRGVGM